MPDPALPLKPPGGLQASAFSERPVQKFAIVDPMKGEEVDILQLKVVERGFKGLNKFLGILKRGDLGLDDEGIPGDLR